jgi:hypothetical protein
MQLCPKFNLFMKYWEICWSNTLGFAAVTAYKNNVSRMKQLLSHDFRRPPPKGLYMGILLHLYIAMFCRL